MSILPIAQWLPKYQRRFLKGDLVAGVSTWALVVPQAVAYGQIAGMPAQAGLDESGDASSSASRLRATRHGAGARPAHRYHVRRSTPSSEQSGSVGATAPSPEPLKERNDS
jgi:hypothetical protein